MSLPKLNFPQYAFRLARRDGVEMVWDPLRGGWLRLTPEEWVRRHVIEWLKEDRGVAAQLICQEYPVSVCGQPQRADVVVMSSSGEPLMLIECKAPAVRLCGSTLGQAVRYNSVVGARYIMLTNGLIHFFWEKSETGEYVQKSSLPDI